ncbi:potassium-transporting ATPase subunit KdpB [Mycobacteroides chelonae]|uniref:potassium-transporting ATPase subunit KdpB n=1 Tax=Mycobacteroides chelonae TaxID=1774 RepID=UPI000991E1E0|nr:potassium-transporting ATPase subunit KdpB [Mycobacteroides chelonae]MBF9326289.1 potassium-transporting ATPase subunit KdpB [Mycobacteroides chelonae]MBF9351599.1 potassium-transporting ATPase subunit KdpB [Mycobacteroides chelonae]MBF9420464.1 potassium-transporting ATPase subunit KdpB [Mycobacteroides chelonae]MBF9438875.1 potassium-transporting ATPase subunit KdpB [Mycobacteroides chelonae]MBV6360243.1 potassium-transporting ATPase subunit KdpB [Mycobacteroides chelonae]
MSKTSKSTVSTGVFDPTQLVKALPLAVRKLDPRHMARNPVMFVVTVGSVATTVLAALHPSIFAWAITAWLWFTVVFANLAEAVAEGRGKAQAASLREVKRDTVARKLVGDGHGNEMEEEVAGSALRPGDRVVVEAGQVIPGDGDVVEGIATVDESAITGESAPVVRESGGDRCAVTGGTTVLSDRIVVEITAAPGESFVDRMIALVEGAARQKTPNEIALNILLASLTIIFLLAVVALGPMGNYGGEQQDPIKLIALLVCLIPTTIGALMSAIGIAGMDRLVQHNVLAKSGRAVEAAGDIDVLLMDKTGTITFGNRQATEFIVAPGITHEALAQAARASSLADETPEGRSIVELAAGGSEPTAKVSDEGSHEGEFVAFTAATRMSGLDTTDGKQIRKGAADAVFTWVASLSGVQEDDPAVVVVRKVADQVASEGGTPLVVADHDGTETRLLGVIRLSDVVKPGMAERFAQMRAMGIRTVMVTGDNPLTAKQIAAEAGVDDYVAEATPEDKLELLRREQKAGRLVAMTGDGTNDAPALAQADVGVAMNTGTSAAKEAGNMVDLDSDPTKLIDVVAIGKQLLITRGALTTFSLANDLAKYFAILPALFSGIYPQLGELNIMRLATPQSAILSAVIFNALVIIALVPLALKGVRYRPVGAGELLRRNLLIYGLGGVIVPFVGIWLIDLVVRFIPGIG